MSPEVRPQSAQSTHSMNVSNDSSKKVVPVTQHSNWTKSRNGFFVGFRGAQLEDFASAQQRVSQGKERGAYQCAAPDAEQGHRRSL